MMGITQAKGRQAPGPRGFELVRYLRSFYSDPLTLFANLGNRYGDVTRLELGPYLMHVLFAPAHFEHILVTKIDIYPKAGPYHQTQPVLGNGLANNSRPGWRVQRRLVAAALKPIKRQSHTSIVIKATKQAAAAWGNIDAEAPPLDLWQGLMDLHFEIMVQVLFGVKPVGDVAGFQQALAAARDIMDRRLNAIWSPPDWVPTRENRRLSLATNVLNDFVAANLREVRSTPDSDCVLDRLVQLSVDGGHALSDLELRDELMSLMFAGIEDPVNVLSWTLYLLACTPITFQMALRAEVDAVFREGSLDAEDLSHMSLMRRLIREAMRLYPPGWGFLRDAAEDDVVDGYTIPAGSMVFLPVYLLHRRPSAWPEGAKFLPDRMTEPLSPDNLAAFLPFGAGERSCVGEEFAWLEIQLILTFMLSQFDLELSDNIEVKPAALQSLRPRSRLPLTLRPRKTG